MGFSMRMHILSVLFMAIFFTFTLEGYQRQGQDQEQLQLKLKTRLQELFDELGKSEPPQGEPFPRIKGPSCKASRIGIVGAGPSGIHMAYLLKKTGFENVEILEQTHRLGGKCSFFNINGEIYSNTGLVTADYQESVIALMKEFGIFNATVWDSFLRFGTNFKSKVVSMRSYFMGLGNPFDLLDEMERYIVLHRNLFGTYRGELMRKPHQEILSKYLQGSFHDFLLRNHLRRLSKVLEVLIATTGYKGIQRMPALQGLMFFTPRMVLGTFSNMTLAVSKTSHFKVLFEKMIEDQNIHITYNYEVDYIKSNPDGTLMVFTKNQNRDTKTYDFLIWSGLLRDFVRRQNFINDPNEEFMFSSNNFIFSAGALASMENDLRPQPTEIQIDLARRFDGDISIVTDSEASRNGIHGRRYASRDYAIRGRDPKVRTVIVLLYGNSTTDFSAKAIENKVTRYLVNGFNATNVNVIDTVIWKYYPHWSIKQVSNGIHWDMFGIQGKYNMWFTGGGVSFDTTRSVFEYNELLLRQSVPASRCSYTGSA